MRETSKSIMRRVHDSRFANRYFVGDGIDIGCGHDSIDLYREFFPALKSCRPWDMPDGDAQYLATIGDQSLDFAHSSHCLEHMKDPLQALHNWVRILKPTGYLVCIIPDEDMYEQGVFPSRFNGDHKWTFTIHKSSSWSNKSINVSELLASLGNDVQIIKIELLDQTYRYSLPQFDQTMTPVGESAIEFILRKRPLQEIADKGRLPENKPVDSEQFFKLTGFRLK
ncbi:MAG: methyltransferase domain-containing protein [Pseudomonadota bacterium]